MLKSLTQEKLKLYQNILYLTCSLGALGLALYTLHDMQTAEGAGLYLSLLYGQTNRILFDLLVDIMGMLVFWAILLLPCLLLKHLNSGSFFRLLAVFLAIMPIAHPGDAVHLGNKLIHLQLRESLLNGDLMHILFMECVPAFEVIKYTIPFLILLIFTNKNLHLPNLQQKKLLFSCILVLFILYLLFDNIEETTLYLLHYFLLIWCFGEWETTCKHSPRFANWSLILFIGCLLRGIYRMLEMVSHAHL